MKLRLLIGSLNLVAIKAHVPGTGGPSGLNNGLGKPEEPQQDPPVDPAMEFGYHCKNGQHNCPANAACIDTQPSGFRCECNQGKRSKIISYLKRFSRSFIMNYSICKFLHSLVRFS